MKKRIIAVVLCLATLFISLPMTVGAASYTHTLAPGTGNDDKSNFTNLVNTLANYSAGDEVTVYVSNSGQGTTCTPNWWSWPGKNYHSATVTVTTASGEDKAALYLNGGANICVYGNTVFKNVRIVLDWFDRGIYTNGHSVTLDSTVEVAKDNYSGMAKLYFGGRANGNTTVGTGDAVVTLDGKSFYNGTVTSGDETFTGGVIIGSDSQNNDTLPGNQTLVSKNNDISLFFAASKNITFGKNLNIVLENANVKSAATKYDESGSTIVNGAVQILANGTSQLDAGAVYAAATGSGVTANGGVYLLDSSNQNGTLSLTDVVGTYKIEGGHEYAYAYDSVNQAATVYYGKGTLTVNGSGNYAIGYADSLDDIIKVLGNDWGVNTNGTITRGSRSAYYYVAPNGTGDGRTADTPAKAITIAMASIVADGYAAGDNVTIYVSGGEGVTAVPADLATNYAWPWPKVNDADVTTAANLTITTKSGSSSPAILEFGGASLVAFANTVYKNIILLDKAGKFEISTNCYDVTFDEDVYFKKGSSTMSDYSPKIYKGNIYGYSVRNNGSGTVTVNNTTGKKSYSLVYGGYAGDPKGQAEAFEMNGDQTFVINGGNVEKLYLMDNGNVTYDMVYNSNLNVVLNGATLGLVAVSNSTVTPVIKGAIQFVANNGAVLPKMTSIENFAEENDIPYFTLVASGSANGILTPTETVGTYTVKSNGTYAVAYDSVNQPDTLYYGINTLTVKGEGRYSVAFVDDLAKVKDIFAGNWGDNENGTMTRYPDGAKLAKYYVAPNGTGDGRTADTSAKGITKAMASIIADGYTANDYVTIYVSGGEGATTLPSAVATNFAYPWAQVDGANATTQANITITSKPGAASPALLEFGDTGFTVMANTVFKNIILVDKAGNNSVYTNGFNVTFDDDVTFKKGTDLKEYQPAIFVGSLYNNAVSYKSDSTLTINNTNGNKKYTLNFGGYSWDGADGNDANFLYGSKTVVINGGTVNGINLVAFKRNAEYNSNINIVLNGATLNSAAVSSVEGYVPVINGAIQFVANNGAKLPDLSTIKSYADSKNIPYFLLDASAADNGKLMTTSTAGTYNVTEGYTAVAVVDNETTEQYVSSDGALIVPKGKYTVSMLDNSKPYICDGSTINVYVPCKIDFSTVTPKLYSVENKLFIGWKVKSTGKYATSDTQLNIGDVLEAQYLDCTAEDFGVSTEIRTVGNDGLRFIVDVKKSFFTELPNASEYGSIILPVDSTLGRDIFLDEAVVYDWTWDEETRMNFTANNTGSKPTAVKAVNMFATDDNSFKYTLCLTGIKEANYDRYYMMRGYIKYVDHNGVERVAYTEHANTSLYRTAHDTIDGVTAPSVKAKLRAIIDYVEVTLKEQVLNQPKHLYSGYEDCDDTDPNHKIYYQNGVYVRDITVSTGKNLSSPIKIAAFSDTHINHINLRDIEEARATTLATYRGRGWGKEGSHVRYTNTTVNLARFYDKTVVIGDIMDYLSWGCADVMKRSILDRFTAGKVIPMLGNHEQLELMVPDIGGLSDTLTDEEKDNFLRQYWPVDLYYHSEIVKDASGNDGVMIVTMMNGWDVYYESQKTSLENDIADAKSKNIPILVFQHNPICTGNPADAACPVKNSNYEFGTDTNKTGTEDLYNRYAGNKSGNAGSDATTMSVYNLIAQNYDVIKGVFHAHKHLNMYTEIRAQDKNGDFISDENGVYVTIPQYGTRSVADSGGAMMSITVQ